MLDFEHLDTKPSGEKPFYPTQKQIWKDRIEDIITKVATRIKKVGIGVDDLGAFLEWNSSSHSKCRPSLFDVLPPACSHASDIVTEGWIELYLEVKLDVWPPFS